MVIRTPINSAQSIFFGNITCRQAISPVAKFHHVLGRGFMIQQVMLVFIKCLIQSESTILNESIIYTNYYSYLKKPCLSLMDDNNGILELCKMHNVVYSLKIIVDDKKRLRLL